MQCFTMFGRAGKNFVRYTFQARTQCRRELNSPSDHPALRAPLQRRGISPTLARRAGDGKNDVRWCCRCGSPDGLGRNGVLLRFYSANLFVRFLLRLNFFLSQVVDTQCVDCVLGSCYTTTNLTAFPPLYLCRWNQYAEGFSVFLTCCSVFAIFMNRCFLPSS